MPPALAAAPFSVRAAQPLVGRRALAGPAYQRLARGAYSVAGAEITHGLMIEAMLAVLPDVTVLRGWSAVWLWGLEWADPDDPVEVVLPHRRRARPRPGLLVTGETLHPAEVVLRRGIRVTDPARTAFDLARRLPDDEAVAVVDALLRVGGVGPEAVLTVLERHPRASGRQKASAVVARCDPRAESPRESMLRLAVHRAGLPAPVPQFVVRVDGRFVARLDLAWPELRVALEYDGAHHRDRAQHGRDIARHNALRSAGWVVFQVDATQWPSLDQVLASVGQALAARAGEGASR